MVDKEIGQTGEVVPPRQEETEKRDRQQRPLHRTLACHHPEEREPEDEGTHVDRSRREGLIPPVAVLLRHEGTILHRCLTERRLIIADRTARSPLGIRDQQRQRLIHAVAPGGDIVPGESLGGGFAALRRDGAPPAHRLLLQLPGVVETRAIEPQPDKSTQHHRQQSLAEVLPLPLTTGFHRPGNDHPRHEEGEVVAHLVVVAENLQPGEDRHDDEAQSVVSSVKGVDQSRDRRRDKGEGGELPDVTRLYQDEEVGGEGPEDRPEDRQPPPQPPAPHEEVPAEEHHQEEIGISRHQVDRPLQPEETPQRDERGLRVVVRADLIGGHPPEEAPRPAGPLPGLLIVVDHIPPCALRGGTIHLVEHAVLKGSGIEVGIREPHKEEQRQQHIKPLLPVPLLLLVCPGHRVRLRLGHSL